MTALGWLIFAVALLASIMLHEAGHLVTAKKFGMKATQYFVGFGTTIWSTVRGETEYGIKALPFGGFVKIVGMTSLEEVDPEDEPRSFRRQPGWQRVIVLVAGSFMHGLIGFVLLFVVAVGIGLANPHTTRVGVVSSCVPAGKKAYLHGTCAAGDATSPAKRAGFRPGDTIVSYDHTPVRGNWNKLGTAIRRTPAGRTVRVTVLRDGRDVTLHVTPASVPGRSGSYLGVGEATVFQRLGPVHAATYAGDTFGSILVSSGQGIADLPSAIPHLFAKNRAQTPGGDVSSIVGVGEITGQVVGGPSPAALKVDEVLLIVAELNIFIGAFNLLPLLPLDGGHIAVVLYERARAQLARLLGRPDPGMVDMNKLIPLSVGVFGVLVVFGVMLILADIVNPISLS